MLSTQVKQNTQQHFPFVLVSQRLCDFEQQQQVGKIMAAAITAGACASILVDKPAMQHWILVATVAEYRPFRLRNERLSRSVLLLV